MSLIPEATVRTILDRTDIVAVIGDYVRLEKRGGRWLGVCPFHAEKTPSFNVDREKGFFYCFGCRKGGDVVTFLREHEKLGYREALEELARRAGVPIELEEAPSEEERARKALLELYERLAAAFHYLLVEHPSGEAARAVLRRRAIPDELREEFRLGYAPRDRRWLHGFLLKKGYSADFLSRSGLFAERHPDFPLFADRLIFPIAQARGEVIAFGGRLLEDPLQELGRDGIDVGVEVDDDGLRPRPQYGRSEQKERDREEEPSHRPIIGSACYNAACASHSPTS